jgi:hypothetical protein
MDIASLLVDPSAQTAAPAVLRRATLQPLLARRICPKDNASMFNTKKGSKTRKR